MIDYKMGTFSEVEHKSVSLDALSEYISLIRQNQAKQINTDDYFIAVNPGNLPLDRFFELKGFVVTDPSLPKTTVIFGFDVYIDRMLPIGAYMICPKLIPKLTLKLGGIGDKSIEIIEE